MDAVLPDATCKCGPSLCPRPAHRTLPRTNSNLLTACLKLLKFLPDCTSRPRGNISTSRREASIMRTVCPAKNDLRLRTKSIFLMVIRQFSAFVSFLFLFMPLLFGYPTTSSLLRWAKLVKLWSYLEVLW